MATPKHTKKSQQVTKAVNQAIDAIDPSLPIEDFALAVGDILRNEYGSLDYDKFNEVLSSIINEVIEENPHLNEAGITGWVIDKVANGLKWATNRKADYQYDALLRSKKFKSLAKKYNMSEKEWDKIARNWVKKDPKKFAKILSGKISGPLKKYQNRI